MYFSPEDIFPIEDVDAVMWINNSTLLFTVSPIYGCPGIFVYNYHNKLLKQIMKPKIIDKYFPCGADYFELAGFDFSNRTILFYYSSYVDSIDFNSFRSEKNLFRVKLNIED